MARNYRFFLRNPESLHLVEQNKEVFEMRENLEPDIFFQLVKVLRVQHGDMVTLIPRYEQDEGQSDNKVLLHNFTAMPALGRARTLRCGSVSGVEYDFEVISASKHGLELKPKGVRENLNELNFPLNLWLCVPNKPDKLEFILQKSVEIGVANVTLFESDFSQMKHVLRTDRLEKIMMEAAEQSERAFVPTLKIQGSLLKILPSLVEGSAADSRAHHVWVAMERMKRTGLLPMNPFVGADFQHGLTVLVGPEGGFSETEKALFEEFHLNMFSLGKRILRMETAVVLSLGLAALLDA